MTFGIFIPISFGYSHSYYGIVSLPGIMLTISYKYGTFYFPNMIIVQI